MAKLRYTARFRLDYRRGMRKGCSLGKLKSLLALLCRGAPLPLDCRDTAVRGTKARACRVEPGCASNISPASGRKRPRPWDCGSKPCCEVR